MRISDWSSDVCSSDLLDAARAGALDDVVAADRAAAIGDGAPCGGRAHRARALEAVDGDESMVLAVDDADHQAGETVEIEEAIVLGMNGTRRSEEHTSELQSLMRISYAVFCLKKKTTK